MTLLCVNSTPAERARGCVFAEKCESAGKVVRNNGVINGTPTIHFGATLNGTTDGIEYALCGNEYDSNEISIVFEFTPHFNYDDNTNFWLSIPLANFKKRDIVTIPDKQGFINSGKKVFIQVKNNEDGELDYKLHLSNKKLYKERGNLTQYRENHKNNRKLRNHNEKMKRVKNRELKRLE